MGSGDDVRDEPTAGWLNAELRDDDDDGVELGSKRCGVPGFAVRPRGMGSLPSSSSIPSITSFVDVDPSTRSLHVVPPRRSFRRPPRPLSASAPSPVFSSSSQPVSSPFSSLLAFLSVQKNANQVFLWLQNISTIGGIIAWFCMNLTYLRFCKCSI